LEEKVKSKKLRQLFPSHFLLEVKLQELGNIKGLSVSVFLFKMLTGYKTPWMGRGTKRIKGMSSKGKS
jgi:hypothetical protein